MLQSYQGFPPHEEARRLDVDSVPPHLTSLCRVLLSVLPCLPSTHISPSHTHPLLDFLELICPSTSNFAPFLPPTPPDYPLRCSQAPPSPCSPQVTSPSFPFLPVCHPSTRDGRRHQLPLPSPPPPRGASPSSPASTPSGPATSQHHRRTEPESPHEHQHPRPSALAFTLTSETAPA